MSTDPWAVPARRRRFPATTAVVVSALALAFLAFAWSAYEARTQRRELESVMRAEGSALVEAVGHAVEHALQAGIQMEELSSERLLDQTRFLERLDSAGLLRSEMLLEMAAELGLSRITVLDSRLLPVMHAPPDAPDPFADPYGPSLPILRPLLEGSAEGIVLAPGRCSWSDPDRFVAAVRRSRGGVILASLDAADIFAFEDQLGAGNLMHAVAETGGILYALLEDNHGRELARATSRKGEDGYPAMEVGRPVELAHGETGRLKIGLSTEALAAASRASGRRSAVAAALVFGLTLALSAVAIATRRSLVLRGEAARARSITGAVLEGMADAVVVTDSQGIIRLANPAAERLLGVPAGSLVGQPCAGSPCAALMRCARRDGQATEMELPRPEGPPAHLLAAVSPVRTEEGEEIGTALLVRDLSDLKRLEQEARRTESLVAFGRLAATVAHEVRNPLNAIAVGVQRLGREFPPRERDDEHRKLTGLLRSEIDRLNGTVTRFLELARPPRIEPRAGDLASLVREMVRLLAEGAPPGVRLVEEGDELPPVLFDVAAVRQVILNLVRNAIEAVGGKGTIRVSTRREGGRVLLAVADDGPGIAPENRDRIFDFGFTTKPDGNGLGLSIVHRLVTEMGGTVSLGSGAGGGTEVRVLLPLSKGSAA